MALKLKPSEVKLLSAFGIVLFLIANFLAFTFWQQLETKTAGKKAAMTKELKHLESLKAQVPVANQYQDALTQHLKRYDSLDTRDTYLTTFVQNQVDKLSLKLAKNAPLAGEQPDPDKPAKFIKSAYRAEVSGDWKKVLEFIYNLQEPTEFRYAKTMTLSTRKNDAGDGSSDLVCDFTLQKWWHPDSDVILADQETAVPAEPAAAKPESAPAAPIASAPPADKPKETERNATPTVGNPAPAPTVQ